ncbi:MAG: class I SAM-dependent methyltransferase [Polyangiaceae bacterium]
MTFDVAADEYDRYIGRYSRELAPRFATFAGVEAGHVLDVGCGPGALTSELARRVGAERVTAVDPSEPFVVATRARVPGADIRLGGGEELPFSDDSFSAALSQLVLSFVRDADRMSSEMTRVVGVGGTVAFCTFEANGFTLVRTFWDAALRFDAHAPDDARLAYRRMDELVALCERARLRDVLTAEIALEVSYESFEDLWSPFGFGIGPAAGYLKAQSDSRRDAIRAACFELLGKPGGAFVLDAKVLAVRGQVIG